MNFQRFEHVNQICRDLDRTQHFYQTLFPEWTVRAEGEHQGWRWRHLGDDHYYLALNQPPVGTVTDPATGHIDHIGLVIRDASAMQARLDQHQIPYEVYHSPETTLRLYVDDPDGTQVELVAYQPDYPLR
ncbi:MAG: hypothetical protein OHK0012_10950 [Synechococcales cyanobacterium]